MSEGKHVAERIRQLWRLALSTADRRAVEVIPGDVPFSDLGGNSASAVALGLLLREEFGTAFGRATAYEYPTVSAQVEAVTRLSAEHVGRAAEAQDPAVADAPARAAWPEHAIAVVSASVRVPGAATLEEYWALLESGRCVIGPVPGGRNFSRAEAGGFLRDVGSFDHQFFGISRADAVYMDPQQRLALELAWEALETAGYADRGGRPREVGVFMGATRPDFDDITGPDSRLNGSLIAMIASRVSYCLDLTGPSECIDTACSSSAVAVQRACESLNAGDCSMALAGGVSVLLTDRRHRLMRVQQMISPTGSCRPFDERADGMVPGEGGGMVLLKRLPEAIRDGDPVLGVLTGWATNNNGRGNGINAPNADSQRAVIRAACARAGIEPASLAYIEAHGTGTPVGDSIETVALRDCLAGAPVRSCGIGSVKGQIGHLEWAAGIAGLIKVLLALHEDRLPPSGSFRAAGPGLELTAADCPLWVVDHVSAWRGRRAAGVSSLGAGGTNCHLVVEAPSAAGLPPGRLPSAAAGTAPPDALLTISARSAGALRNRLTRLREAAVRHPEAGGVPAAALSRGRGLFAYRAALPVGEPGGLVAAIDHALALPDTTIGRLVQEGGGTSPVGLVLTGGLTVDSSWLDRAGADDSRFRARYTAGRAVGRAPGARDDGEQADKEREARAAAEAALAGLWRDRGLRPAVIVAVGDGRISLDLLCQGERGGPSPLPHGADVVLLRASGPSIADGEVTEFAGLDAAVRRLRELGVGELLTFRPETADHAALAAGQFQTHCVADPVRSERAQAAETVARLYRTGYPIALDDTPRSALASPYLPSYPFDRGYCWPETSVGEPDGSARPSPDGGTRPSAGAFTRSWAPLALPPLEELAGPVLLLSDAGGTGERLAHRLQDMGVPAVLRAQPALAGRVPGDRLAPEETISQLLDGDAAGPVRDVIWLTELPSPAGPSGQRHPGQGVLSLLSLARLLARRTTAGRFRLLVATAGAFPVTGDAVPDPAQRMIAGAVPSLRRELRDVDIQLADLDPASAAGERAEALIQAARWRRTAPLAACRSGRWHEPGWSALPSADARHPAIAGGTYLITGGLGALAVATAEWLTAPGAVHLHLVTRRTPPARADWAGDPLLSRLAALGSRGSSVTVHQADVADPYVMSQVIQDIKTLRGGISGVVHAAGVAADRAVARFDVPGFAERVRAKVDGGKILDDLLAADDLDFFLLYGSAISFSGNAGQTEYGAANSYFDWLAAVRRSRGLRATSVSWSTWNDTGMAARPGFGAKSAGLGLPPIRPADALGVLASVVASGEPCVCVAAGAPDEAGGAAVAAAVRAEQAGTSPGRSLDRVLDVTAGVVSRRLGETSVDLDSNLFDLGANSLDLLAIVAAVNAELGTNAPDTIVFDAPTVSRLATRLAAEPGGEPTAEPGAKDTPVPEDADPAETLPVGGRGTVPAWLAVPAETARPRSTADRDIAVIGLACRFANAPTPEGLWQLLLDGGTAIGPVSGPALFGTKPDDEFTAALLPAPYEFDPLTFRISPAEAVAMDPQQRLALELAWEALERSARAQGPHARTGVFLGAEPSRYPQLLGLGRHDASGGANTTSLIANRVSYALRLGGPSLVCDTACSSAAVAIHLARMSLLAGESDLALAGGIKILVDWRGFAVNAAAGLLSRRGRLSAFGTDADGYVRGEGGAIVVLRRLSDALADGDRIIAVLKASSVAHGGGDTVGLSAPSPGAQRELLAGVWRDAGVDPDRLAFIEAHGTGTLLGDAVEIEALSAAAREYGIRTRPWLGTVKTSIGHTEAAAGAAGFVKATLSLAAGVVPPMPAVPPRPELTGADSPLRLAETPVPIGVPGRAQAGVSSFGFGGVNAHLVLEQPPDAPPGRAAPGRWLAVVSARTLEALAHLQTGLAARLDEIPGASAADVAGTLALGRFHLPVRRAWVVSGLAELAARLRASVEPARPTAGVPARRVNIRLAGLARPTATELSELCGLAPARAVLGEVLPPEAAAAPAAWLDQRWSKAPAEALLATQLAVLSVLRLASVPVTITEADPARPLARLLTRDGAAIGGSVRTPAGWDVGVEDPPGFPDAADAVVHVELGGSVPVREQVLAALGRVYEANADIDWAALWAGQDFRRLLLPTYPFERQSYAPERPAAADPADIGQSPPRPEPPNTERPHWAAATVRWRALAAGEPAVSDQPGAVRWRVIGGSARLRSALTALLDQRRAAAGSGEQAAGAVWLFPDPGRGADGAGWSDVLTRCHELAGQPGTRLVVVFTGTRTAVGQAAAAGFVRGLTDEQPGMDIAIAHVAGLPAELDRQADCVAGLLDALPVRGEFRLRPDTKSGQLDRRSLEPLPLGTGHPFPGRGGVVLVTGGLGGVGGRLATACARAGARDLVLLGRRLPTAGRHPVAEAIRAAGARPHLMQADVTDAAGLGRVLADIRTRLGRIDLVIHAAGHFDHEHRSLVGKSAQSVLAVLAAKADAAELLADHLADDPPDALVLCSSLSALGAGLAGGQADYAAANAYLDAFAESRRGTQPRVLSIGWPQWSETGMSAGRSLSARALALGLVELDPGDGEAAFARLLGSGAEGAVSIVAASADPGALVHRLDARLAADNTRDGAGRDHQPAAAALGLAPAGQAPSAETRPEPEALPGAAAALVRRSLAKILAMDPALIGDNIPFVDLGLDSLGIADLAGALEAELGTVVDPADVLLGPTVAELAGRLPARVRLARPARPPAPDELRRRPPADVAEPAAARAAPSPASAPEPVAVIGMAGRFPGAESVADLWRLLLGDRRAITEIPAGRWDWRGMYDASGRPGTSLSKWGGFLAEPGGFDHDHFGMSRAHAELIDPMQRLFLEVSWLALRDAGQLGMTERGHRSGIFAGARAIARPAAAAPPELARESVVGRAQNFIAARTAHHLDMRGPALVVDTACSSSLVAVHLAVQALLAGDCGTAVAGGVDLLAGPDVYKSLSAAGALSRRGRGDAFAAQPDGYVPAEGAAAVVLKPLGAALRDGDRVYAVVLGSAVNNDGRTIGLTTPDVQAQRDVIQAACDRAGIDPATIGLIEAHGTGTPIGDPIEVRALAQVLGDASRGEDCALGSIKANLGHLHSAAGIAGFIKAVLCVYHQVRLPAPDADRPNPRLAIAGTRLRLLSEAQGWPGGRPRRAGVSAFGFGGTNCHVLLGEAEPSSAEPGEPEDAPGLLLLSARTPRALRADAAALVAWAVQAGGAEALRAHSRTISVGRGHMAYRSGIAGDPGDLLAGLRRLAAGEEPPVPTAPGGGRVVFMYPGQGAQYAGMARELMSHCQPFAAAIEQCARWLDPHSERSLLELLGEADETALRDTAAAQPILFAVEYALDALWRSMAVEPAIVIGHSVGEFAAMVSAGVLSGPDAARLVAHRGRLMAACPPGAMLGVRAGEAEIADALGTDMPGISIGALNSPDDAVIGGAEELVRRAGDRLRRVGLQVFPLRVSHAFHTSMMEPAARHLTEVADEIPFRQPARASFVSTLTGEAVSRVDAAYLGRELRAPVRFADAVATARRLGGSAFVEVGPGGTLARFVRSCLGEEVLAQPGLVRGRPERAALAGTAAALWQHGASPRPVPLLAAPPPGPVLPPYPFERSDCGISPPAGTELVVTPGPAYVDAVETGAVRRSAMRRFRASEAVMDDHTVRGHRVLPGVSWLSMAAEALAADGGLAGVFTDVGFVRPLTLREGQAADAVVELERVGPSWRFHGSSRIDGVTSVHMRGHFRPDAYTRERVDLAAVRQRCPDELSASQLYERIRTQEIVHGPFYQCLRRARAGHGEAVATLALGPEATATRRPALHPALLDGATTVGAAISGHAPWAAGQAYIPFHIAELVIAAPLPAEVVCHYCVGRLDGELALFDFDLCSPDGRLLARAKGFASKRVPTAWNPGGDPAALLRVLRWVPVAETEEQPT